MKAKVEVRLCNLPREVTPSPRCASLWCMPTFEIEQYEESGRIEFGLSGNEKKGCSEFQLNGKDTQLSRKVRRRML